MNIPFARFTAVATAALTIALTGACGSTETPTPDTSVAPTPSATTPSVEPSLQPDTTNTGNELLKLTPRPVQGVAPDKLPTWKPGGDPGAYTVLTLLYLEEVGLKTGVVVPPINYVVYTGDPKMGCNGLPRDNVWAVVNCDPLGIQNLGPNFVVSVNAPQWRATSEWKARPSASHPLHAIIAEVADAVDGPNHRATNENFLYACAQASLYKAIVTQQPELKRDVEKFLRATGNYGSGPDRNKDYFGGCDPSYTVNR